MPPEGPDLQIVSALLVTFIWSCVFFQGLRRQRQSPPLVPDASKRCAVTALVAARNEKNTIEACVRGLVAQVETLVVIDDHSEDGTFELLTDLAHVEPRLIVLRPSPPVESRSCGKPHALAEGYEAASPTTDWLLFVDADVLVQPGAVAAVVEASQSYDLLSGFPKVEMKRPVEHIVLPSVGAMIMGRFSREHVETGHRPFANGQMILVRRAVYEAAGGHGALRSEILEDVRLAQHVVDAGGRVAQRDLRNIASTRMYSSWTEICEGFSKNLYLLFDQSLGTTFLWATLGLLLAWSGPVALVFWGGPGALAYIAVLTMQMSLRFIGGVQPGWALFAPLGAAAAAYIALRSAYLHRFGRGISWKGRVY